MFKIGEFAAITHIPVSQLRYYDEIDLFKPAHISSDTGYRYYSAEQIPRLNRIIILKDLGFPLDQIRNMVHADINRTQILTLLHNQRDQIIETLKLEIAKLRQIETRIEQMDDEGNLSAHRVVLKTIPDQRFLATRQTLPESDMTRLLSEVYLARGQVITRKPPHLLAVYHTQPQDQQETVDWEVGYVVENTYKQDIRLPSGIEMCVKTLPATGTMATLVYDGKWDGGRSAYVELGRWLEHHDYKISGAFRKVFLQMNDPAITSRAVVEIQIPVISRAL